MIKAVVFDLDDTLIPERQYIESGYHHIAKLLSIKTNIDKKKIERYLKKLSRGNSNNVFDQLFDKLGVTYTQEYIMELVDEYRNHFPDIKFYDDVIPCLDSLKLMDVKVGIITDGYANAQMQKLKAINAYNYFDEIILTDELGRNFWKPHPRSFEMMREKLNIEFDEMIYVGDNPEKDFYISAIYPVKTIRIYRDGIYRCKNYLEGIKANYSINSTTEVIRIVTKYELKRLYDR